MSLTRAFQHPASKLPFEYGRTLLKALQQSSLEFGGVPSQPCKQVKLPLGGDAKQTILRMVDVLAESPLDCLSAPMVGSDLRVIGLSLKFRNSHFRNVPASTGFDLSDKHIIMINPAVSVDPGVKHSWQFECNYAEGNQAEKLWLVRRADWVAVKFNSAEGGRHHMILPFRESRLLQYHLRLLDGQDPMTSGDKRPANTPASMTAEDLENEEFVEENMAHLNMLKDVMKT